MDNNSASLRNDDNLFHKKQNSIPMSDKMIEATFKSNDLLSSNAYSHMEPNEDLKAIMQTGEHEMIPKDSNIDEQLKYLYDNKNPSVNYTKEKGIINV